MVRVSAFVDGVQNSKQNRKGRLLNFREGTDTRYRFDFPESGETVTTDTLSDIDEKLLDIFMTRVEELG